MIFSSTVFLFQFLPAALIIYYAVVFGVRKQLYANAALIVLSLAFYFIGSGALVLLIVGSIAVNYLLGGLIARAGGQRQKIFLGCGIVANLAVLVYFKYAGFLLHSAAGLASLTGWNIASPVFDIALPVGISFYTFMSISYLVDTYKNRDPAPSVLDYGVYLSLFPHLVAGPIVRYSELRDAIARRTTGSDTFLEGVFRFSIGVGRKVIIADSLAVVVDRIFAVPAGDLNAATAWIGIVCYSFQIFFDFAGYTDMAIGIAKMLGFHFPENFDQPYTAVSVTEFWRRWHMTLTRWFRDYLYIPLGGNRRGAARTYMNLFLVFFLCGLWHGAAWTFVIWGMYHGILLVIERVLKDRFRFEPRGPFALFVTFALVTVGWVFFRSPSIAYAFDYLSAMAGAHGVGTVAYALSASTLFYLAAAAAFAFLPSRTFARAFGNAKPGFVNSNAVVLRSCVALAVLFLSVAYVSETTFRPFIYFRF